MYPDALTDLEQRLHDGDDIADAHLLAALPALLAKAVHAEPAFRDRVLRMAAAGVTGHARTRPEPTRRHWDGMWRSALPTVLTLTGHEQPQVRRTAVYLLTGATAHAPDVCRALRERYPREPEPYIRVTLLHTMAALVPALPEPERREMYEWAAPLTGPAGTEGSYAAALLVRAAF
ncbi:hypothetical protein Afil01_45740 [Actinorhabdospora filicis]|uniref:HEAT repeat domain-containing protein n=1 Tax=Actinorhabdospora filicis TaxID=1785913 RepID=A0A9W6SPK0_9ACTN|nr:hypothetical protein [Actinorhabdospora filicis]GLZ79767.1 hypothetical protein Afil01_45740 [Actinorhabdospora filicis]